MTVQTPQYQMWIDWDKAIVSFHPVKGYEPVCFSTRENYEARVHILVQSGFRFQ